MSLNTQFKSQEEKWEPMSEWGRSFADYLANRPKMKIVSKARAPRVREKRQSTGRPSGRPVGPFVSNRKCDKCETPIRRDNTTGLCQRHYKQSQNAKARGKRAA
jgi:hypothetical protein